MNLKLFAAGTVAALGLALSAAPAQAYILGYSQGAGAQLNLCTLNDGCSTVLWTQAPAFDPDDPDVVTVASGSGWYRSDGMHLPGNDLYAVADPFDPAVQAVYGTDLGFHSFLAFALTDLTDQVVSASITLRQGSNGTPNSGASAPAWLRLGSFFGNAHDLEWGTGITNPYTALGAGQAYGYRYFTGADDNTDVTFGLNDDFVAQINASRNEGDDYIILGGRIGTRFEATGVIPEPSTWAMMIVGFLGAGLMLRSHRRAPAAV